MKTAFHKFIYWVVIVSAIISVPSRLFSQEIAPPPCSGVLVTYQYWPEQFVQWVSADLPYSMIELDVDTTAKVQIFQVILTSRTDRKRVVYANSEALVSSMKARGTEAYLSEMIFERADASVVGSTSSLRFVLHDGRPIEWRFVQGSDISEQASGLTAVPESPVPAFAYREEGAVAGEGTALKIGDIVSPAEAWKEISRPPYFVGYRGAVTRSAHRLVLYAGSEDWTVHKGPKIIEVGATWELDSPNGNHRTLRIDKVEGNKITVVGTDKYDTGTQFVEDVTRSGDGWILDQIKYLPVVAGDKHYMTMKLIPIAKEEGRWELWVGKKAKIATANLGYSTAAGEQIISINMDSPTWAKGKIITERTRRMTNEIITTATPN